MSQSSPFRTDGDKSYRWPPEPAQMTREYERVTTLLDGEPKPGLKQWHGNLIVDFVVDNAQDVNLSVFNGDQGRGFFLDQQWWDEVLEDARLKDEIGAACNEVEERPKSRALKTNRVEEMLDLTSAQKTAKYLKAIPDLRRDAAANKGTAVHKLAEQISLGRSVVVPDELKGHVDGAKKFFDDFKPKFIEVESVVYSDKYGYAGQFDWLANIDGKVVMGDYKTSVSGIKSSVALQFAGYAGSDFIGRVDGTKDPLPHIDEFWAINVTTDGYKVIPVTVDDSVWSHFLAVRETHYWLKDKSKTVLGKELKPKEKAA